MWLDVVSHRLWRHKELLSLQPALGVGLLQVSVVWIPTQPCPLYLGTSAVPKRPLSPPPGWAELWLCIAFRSWPFAAADGLGFEHSLVLHLEMPIKLTEAMHTETAYNSGNTHCTQNWNLKHSVHRTSHAYRIPTESHWCQSKNSCEWAVQLLEIYFLL